MKVLVIGCGSIGKRHINNLMELGHKVYAFDVDYHKIPGENTYTIKNNVSHENLDAVFVCTPSSSHAELAITYKDLPLFVEKPLTDNAKDLARLEKAFKDSKITNMVACNMRFEPLIEEAINQIKKLRKIYSVKSEFGYYLPYWRPGVDSDKIECPGVVLDCIHELDLLMWIHGKVLKKHGIIGLPSDRPNKVYEADILLLFDDRVAANIHLDYRRRKKKRQLEWVCEKGTVTYLEKRSLRDPGGEISLFVDDKHFDPGVTSGRVRYESSEDKHNYPYMRQLEYFLSCVEKKEKTFNSINRAIGVTRLALELQGGKDEVAQV